jgi:hypothetical protein
MNIADIYKIAQELDRDYQYYIDLLGEEEADKIQLVVEFILELYEPSPEKAGNS